MKVYIITSAKFEECYIEEWVKYHLNIGFDKIIINDNNPKDYPYNPKDILQKYINTGQVIVERYYDTHNITDCKFPDSDIYNIYTWLYNKYKDEFDWVAKLDIDEFLEIPETNNDVKIFLNQSKFDNVLSIIIPWQSNAVKKEYAKTYTRLKNNRDRFYKSTIDADLCSYKSIVKKSKYVHGLNLHYVWLNDELKNEIINKKIITHVFPDGSDSSKKVGLFTDHYAMDENTKYNEYFKNIVNNVCCINHYKWKSIEEMINHLIKFNANEYPTWHLYDAYKESYKKYPEMFEHPRDLYKLYFIDNINNIQED